MPVEPEIIPYRIRSFISKTIFFNDNGYDTQSIEKEFQLYLKLRKINKSTLVHYLYGERDTRYLIKLYNNSNFIKFVATFHKPKSILHKILKKNKTLKYLDGAIALGSNQAAFIKNDLKIKNVQCIPHGIDTEYFCPNKLIENKKKNVHSILFVGQHLRDFELFNSITTIIKEKWKKININVVLHPSYVQLLKNKAFLNIHSGISDFQLKKLYQNSSFLLLPLKDSTACNSMLESLACGTPVLTTKVGDNADYLDGNCSIMLDNNLNDFIDIIEKFISNGIDIRMRHSARKKALEFDWKEISKKISSFYKEIIL